MNFKVHYYCWPSLPRVSKQTLKIMKLMAIILFAACLQVSARGYSQITLSETNTPLQKVFQKIQAQSGYDFVSKYETLKEAGNVTVNVQNVSLQRALEQCLKDKPLSYEIIGKTVVIQLKEKDYYKVRNNTISLEPSLPPPIEIHGRVVNQKDEPLQNVSVVVSGTKTGTTTDKNGRFTLSVQNNKNIELEISSVGYQTKKVKLEGQTEINVTLKSEATGLSDVVIIAYGTEKRSDLTGSIATIKTSELKQTSIMSVDQGLVGRASGVQVTQTSGMPGAIASIRIRGTSSLQGGNEPLYVIDGVPVYNGDGYGNTGGKTQMSPLSTINPNDIASIDVLKDASATALYGSRAANGVILITTKMGKNGHDVISFDAYYGTQSVAKKINLMDGTNYANLVNEAYTNDGLAPVYSADSIAKIPNNGKGTDWQNEIFRAAPVKNHNLSFSGGDEKTTYDASLNYMDHKGIIIGSDMKRYSGRLNLNRKIGERLRLSSHLSISRILANAISTDVGNMGGAITGALGFNPVSSVYADKKTNTYNLVNHPGLFVANPVATALELKNSNNTTRILGDISGEYEIIKGLKAKVLFALDYFMNKDGSYIPSNIYQSNGVAKGSVSDQMYTNWLNENTITYSKKINQNNKINLLGGVTFQRQQNEGVTAASEGFVNNILQNYNLGSGSVFDQPGSSKTQWSIMSFLGRANYIFKDKYLFTVSGRYDGSSRFGENNKFAFFPSVAAAWKASEEEFIKRLNLFSNLKIRVGHGVTGNQEFGVYQSLPTLGSLNYTLGSNLVTGFMPNKIPNPNLQWERSSEYDVGLDVSVLNNNIALTMDYYYRKTTNLIYNVSIPLISGFGTSLQNMGSMQNKGFELNLETNNINKEFKWSTAINMSFNKNKILQLGGEQYKDIGNGDGSLKTGPVHRLIVDKPVGLFYGYVFDGIFQNQGEVDNGPSGPTSFVGGKRYKDISGPNGTPDGKVDATYDRVVIGNPNPKFYGGISNVFGYKGFELNIFMNYSYGNDILNYNAILLGLPSGGQNVYADLVPWSPDHPGNKYGKATTNVSAVFNSQFIENGSYIKFKTITLSYLFPKLRSKILTGLKVYITGQNLLSFTNYNGYDPEVSYRGASNLEMGEDLGGYPQARSFLFGVSFNLK
ncbi:MAG: TonB-dependent receptor [Ginsengibacter sp.]